MRIRFALAACLTIGAVCPPPAAPAQGGAAKLDLSMRRAAYFDFKSHKEIDLKGRRVAAGGTIKVNKASNTSCAADGCRFAVGLLVFRNTAAGGDPVFKVDINGGTTHTLVFAFEKGREIAVARHETPPLKLGENKLKVVLDPDDKYAESDESNNSLEFTVIVEDN